MFLNQFTYQLNDRSHVINMYYYRLTFVIPLVMCLIHSFSSSFKHDQSQPQERPNQPETSSTSSSLTPLPPEDPSALARTKPFLKQSIFNKPFNLLNGGAGGCGCCSCLDCCFCQPIQPIQPLQPLPPIGGDYSEAGLLEEPNGQSLPGIFNRFGSNSQRVIRRRYVRPNGLVVFEVEEQPTGFRGSSLFGGGGFFSRLLPSALENGNVSRRQQVDLQNTSPSVGSSNANTGIAIRKDRYVLNNRRTRIKINQG